MASALHQILRQISTPSSLLTSKFARKSYLPRTRMLSMDISPAQDLPAVFLDLEKLDRNLFRFLFWLPFTYLVHIELYKKRSFLEVVICCPASQQVIEFMEVLWLVRPWQRLSKRFPTISTCTACIAILLDLVKIYVYVIYLTYLTFV